MSQPFLGEIKIFGFNFAPRGWALCQGQVLLISQNTALFALLGTFYGGNGTTNFALPDLRSRVPLHWGQASSGTQYVVGESTGSETVTLTTAQIPAHGHSANCFTGINGNGGDSFSGANAVPAADVLGGNNLYSPSDGSTMGPTSLNSFGNGLPHTNIQPYLAVNYCIAMQGIFPARN